MFKNFKENYLIRFWSPVPAIAILGILSAYYFGITGTYWAVTGEFTRWGGHILNMIGIDTNNLGYFKIIGLSGTPFDRIDGVMIIGMFGGALTSALMANNIKFRLPQSKARVFQALIGGAIAGFGARLGMGCNLASFFTGISQFSLHAWFFTIAMLVGVYFGNKVATSKLLRSKITMQKVSKIKELEDLNKNAKRNFIFGIIVGIFMIAWVVFLAFGGIGEGKKIPVLSLAMLFGIAFGYIISRAQICFTSAFRDIFLTGRGYMARAIVIGMMLSTIGVFSYIMLGLPPKIMWAGPNAIIGGFLFGFGIVVAGGCECGWMYRAVEGQVHYWIVGIGNVIGSTILALTWDSYAKSLATSFPKLNLLSMFGNYGGLLVNYLLLVAFFVVIVALEKHYLAKKRKQFS